jgi:hypothetical protein
MVGLYEKGKTEGSNLISGLGKPTFFWKLNADDEIPAEGPDYFHVEQVAGPLPEDIKVTAVNSLETSIVRHHLHILSIPAPLSQFTRFAGQLTDKFYGGAVYGYLKIIVPEGRPSVFGRTPMVFKKGSYVVLEMHYHPSGKLGRVRPLVAIYTTKEDLPERNIKVGFARVPKLAAFEKDNIVRHDWIVDDDIRLIQIAAHTHSRGKRYALDMFTPDGKSQNLCRLESYHISAVPKFFKPVFVPKGSVLSAQYTFDNSEQNPINPDASKEVGDGPTADDEMAIIRYFYVRNSDFLKTEQANHAGK